MKKALLLTMAFAFMLCGWAVAQEVTVSGTVTDAADGSSLPGVTVLVKGTSSGSVTDIDGKYSIKATTGGVLIFSFVGYESQEIKVGSQNTIDVKLSSTALALNEVVVTAIGIARDKKALGYSVTSVGASAIQDRPEADVARVLQGKVPGVNITSTSGVSGSATNIIIRGYSSVTGGNQPLFVVDGVPFNSNTNSDRGFTTGGQATSSRSLDIDPNNIESINVLKGLSATVLYGDQGRNGVVLITTKSGSKKKNAEISLTQSVFATKVASAPQYQDTYGSGFDHVYGPFFSNWGPAFSTRDSVPHPYRASGLAGLAAEFPAGAIPANVAYKAYENPVKAFFRTGITSSTSLAISGATDKTSYSASFGHSKEEGFTPGNTLTKYNIGLGINTSLTEKLTVSSSIIFALTNMETPPINAGYGSNSDGGIPSIFANVLYTPRSVDLANWPYETPLTNRSIYYRGGNDIVNPKWAAKYYRNTSNVQRFFNSTTLNYQLATGLNFSYRVGFDTYNEVQEVRLNKGGPSASPVVLNGAYQTINIKNTLFNQDFVLNYAKDLSERVNISALIGFNARNDQYEQTGIASQNQLAFNLFRHDNFVSSASTGLFGGNLNSTQEEQRMGAYGAITLDYLGYLFVNVVARNDWSSTLEQANRSIFYPGASVSFIPTEAFDMKSKVLSYLKIRGGFGSSAGFPSPYSTRSVLAQNSRAFVDGGGTPVVSHTLDNYLGNASLRPELHQEFEVGVEGRFLDSRINLDLSLYNKNTRDLITDAPLDPSTGYTLTSVNIGRVRNRGIEMVLGGDVIKNANLVWNATLNYNMYRSVVMELTEGLDEIPIAGFTDLGNFAIPGQPFNVIKGSAIARDEDGNKIVNGAGSYLISSGIEILGDPNPDFTSSLINAVTYKGITLSFMMEYRHGGVIYSTTAAAMLARGVGKDTDFIRELPLILPGVTQDGQPNTKAITSSTYTFDNFFNIDETNIFDGSTIRLREVSLGYSLPQNLVSKTPFKGVSLSLTGSNLWFKALNMPRYMNFDTDMLSLGVGNGMGFDFLTGPSARRFGGTLKLRF